jgi:hypothetical protein
MCRPLDGYPQQIAGRRFHQIGNLHSRLCPTIGEALNCCDSVTLTAPKPPKALFPRYLPSVGPSDDSAVNPGILISVLPWVALAVDDVSCAIGERGDDVDDIAHTAESRRTYIDCSQRAITALGLRHCRINRRIAHRRVVERAMLVGGTRIVGHLHDAVEHFCCGLPKISRSVGLNHESVGASH